MTLFLAAAYLSGFAILFLYWFRLRCESKNLRAEITAHLVAHPRELDLK